MSTNVNNCSSAGANIRAFAEIEELSSQCRFDDCNHQGESGCAVLAALKNGSLSASQWKNYKAQREDNNFIHTNSAYQRQNEAFRKTITMHYRAMKKV
ncbi:MAG: hypothetical protein FWB73_02145 [Treponema sp.]|nr:hypothetical protein [Treponema sp.]